MFVAVDPTELYFNISNRSNPLCSPLHGRLLLITHPYKNDTYLIDYHVYFHQVLDRFLSSNKKEDEAMLQNFLLW